MNKSDRAEIYKKAQTVWGIDTQISVAIEEFAELITALAKRKRIINGSTDKEIINEIADAWVMLEHLTLIYDEDKIMERIEYKVKRLKSWIDNNTKVW